MQVQVCVNPKQSRTICVHSLRTHSRTLSHTCSTAHLRIYCIVVHMYSAQGSLKLCLYKYLYVYISTYIYVYFYVFMNICICIYNEFVLVFSHYNIRINLCFAEAIMLQTTLRPPGLERPLSN